MTDLLLIPLTLVLLLAATLGTAAALRAVRTRRRRRRRVVEAPNSHHTWQKVRELEICERWRNIDLARMHPINREEVERLLDIVQAGGPDVLRPRERTFLDYMAEIAGTVAASGDAVGAGGRRAADSPSPADLRHRTT